MPHQEHACPQVGHALNAATLLFARQPLAHARGSEQSRDRQGADAQSFMTLCLVLLFAIRLPAAQTLDVYVVDADGGKAMLVVTPSGQSMVMDAGYAGYINDNSQVIQPND